MSISMSPAFVFALCFLGLGCLTACGDDESSASAGGAGGSGSGELTLDSCDTSFAEGVPEFYQRYFRCVDVSMSGDSVVIRSDGQPPHRSFYYGETHPNFEAFDSMGDTRMPNPNRIAARDVQLTIDSAPTAKGLTIDAISVDGEASTDQDEYRLGDAGFGLDGVALFNGVAAPGDSLANEETTFDRYEAHAEMTGGYHYHGPSPGPLEVLKHSGMIPNATPGTASIELYGIMCDGTVLLGCTELDGSAPDDSDFDAQNGHVHDISDGDTVHFAGRYHTHMCRGTFPHDYTPELQFYVGCN
jgi:hypothetical protein